MPYTLLQHDVLMLFGLLTIPIAIILVGLFFVVYRCQRSVSLLGLPIGFLFLTISFTFLGIHLVYPYSGSLSTSLMWLRVSTQTWGFILIAISYFFKNRTQMKSKYSFISLTGISIAIVLGLFATLLVIDPDGLPAVYADNSIFTVVNLGIITFILVCLFGKIKLAQGKVSSLLAAPIAFGLLWLGQLLFFVWDFGGTINGNYYCLLGSEVTRLASLVIFVLIYYSASREISTVDKQQTKQG